MDTLVKAMTKDGAIRILVTNTTQTIQEAANASSDTADCQCRFRADFKRNGHDGRYAQR